MPRPTTIPEPWRSLAEKLGGVQALADELHAGVATVRRWAHEIPPPKGTAKLAVDRLFREHGLQPPE